jgi:DNA-binding MarR family transcriptional regulator
MIKPTKRQAEFLAFIRDYTKLNRQSPSEAEMQRHFGVTPPTVHQMVLTLERRGFITRTPGTARSIRLLLGPNQLPLGEPVKAIISPKPQSILGHWRITQMEMWDQEFVDAEVEGYVRLDEGGSGEFQFGYVSGTMDHELTERNGKLAAEWSWEGNDEMDEASGRGWAVLQDDGTIKGKLSFHQGDKSWFVAVRKGDS